MGTVLKMVFVQFDTTLCYITSKWCLLSPLRASTRTPYNSETSRAAANARLIHDFINQQR